MHLYAGTGDGPLFNAGSVPAESVESLAGLIAGQPKRSRLDRRVCVPKRDHDIRAGWAARGLVAYAQHLGGAKLNEDIGVALTDLLGDLRHLCDALGVDWDAAVSRSEYDHYCEVRGIL